VSEDWIRRAREREWPSGLIERAIKLRTPREQVEWWLSLEKPSLNNIERELNVFERLAGGRLKARELSGRDLESFAELWSNAPETIGDWEIIVERGPDPIAQFRLQDDATITVLEEDGILVACTAWTAANTIVGGEPGLIIYAHSLRVHRDKRREGFGDIVRRFPRRAMQRFAIGQVHYQRTGNVGVDKFLRTVGFRENSERPTKEASVIHLTARAADADKRVRAIAERDLGPCVALINRTHEGLDLFAPLTVERFRFELDEHFWGRKPSRFRSVYGWNDMFVLEENGSIAACGGLWDRGRDMRERWRSKSGEERTVEAGALLDFGFAPGREDALARLIRALGTRAHAAGRATLIAPLEHLPEVVARLSDLDPREERRTLEWAPYVPEAPKAIGRTFSDLRYW
jgi:hypothetical protein